jgi:hypothetical protein
MQSFLSLGTDCVKIEEAADASKGFFFCSSLLLHCFPVCILLLTVVDIISLFTVALATALDRVAALEAKLKTAIEVLKDANTAKVSAKVAETKAKKAKKALAEANQKQTKREQAMVERLDEISTSVGSKCFILSLGLC